MTAAVGHTNSSSSEAAPRPRRTASCAVERGPKRPANAPSRLAMKGAAASAARPSGSRPPRRAIVGSSVVTSATLTPTPTAAIRSRARFRPTSRWVGDGRSDGRSTRYLEAGPLGLRGELTGSAWVSPSRSVRVSPQGGGSPVLIEEVRPSPMLPAAAASGPYGSLVRGSGRRRAVQAAHVPLIVMCDRSTTNARPGVEHARDRVGLVGRDLPRRPAAPAVEMAVVGRRQDVELLAPVHAVVVAEVAQALEDVERPVHRRRGRRRVELAAALDELRPGHVAVAAAQHLDQRPALRRPAQALRVEAVADLVPGRRSGVRGRQRPGQIPSDDRMSGSAPSRPNRKTDPITRLKQPATPPMPT